MACDSYDLAGFAFWAGLWAWVCVREWKKREGADEQKERP